MVLTRCSSHSFTERLRPRGARGVGPPLVGSRRRACPRDPAATRARGTTVHYQRLPPQGRGPTRHAPHGSRRDLNLLAAPRATGGTGSPARHGRAPIDRQSRRVALRVVRWALVGILPDPRRLRAVARELVEEAAPHCAHRRRHHHRRTRDRRCTGPRAQQSGRETPEPPPSPPVQPSLGRSCARMPPAARAARPSRWDSRPWCWCSTSSRCRRRPRYRRRRRLAAGQSQGLRQQRFGLDAASRTVDRGSLGDGKP